MSTHRAHINAIGTAVPKYDVHRMFIGWALNRLTDDRVKMLFERMAGRSGIAHRWSVLPDAGRFYGDQELPSTSERMAIYAEAAPALAQEAIAGIPIEGVTHLVVASCTGFVAPGIDQIIAARLGLPASTERTLVGFMGCYAAVAALRVAHHIVRSEPSAKVLVVTVELSTLHLQATQAIEPLLAMLQFADGAAAALVSAEPRGLSIGDFFAAELPDSAELIRWTIGDRGFVMHLSGAVPARIGEALHETALGESLRQGTGSWAVHAGGRSILDAVEHGLGLGPDALAVSRSVLHDCGNMSSATLMFVLARMMAEPSIEPGIAMAFGPGVAAEGFRFTGVP